MMKKFDVIVIGAGPGGYVAAIRAAQLGFSVACIEKRSHFGGTCLNVGCIPSKSLLQSSEMFWKLSTEGKEHGIDGSYSVRFPDMQQRKEKVVSGLQQGISFLFEKNKITHFNGIGKLLSPTVVEVNGDELEASYIILATGSDPIELPFLPFDEKKVLSSTGALALKSIPKTMIVIGAGVIGVELGSVYSRIGTKVTFVEFLDRICPAMDEACSKELQKVLTKQGMTFNLSSKVTSAKVGSQVSITIEGGSSLEAEVVMVAIGRKPYVKDLGLENVGLSLTDKGILDVDGMFRTKVPSIFAIGDLINGPMLAHKASEEGVAVAEIIAGKNPNIEYMAIPNVVYTSPEVAAVGLTEKEARNCNLDFQVASFPYKASSRAKCMGEDEGFVKILAHTATDRILGIHVIGAHASELIAVATIAMQKKLTVSDLEHLPFAHPTLAEMFKEAALALHKRAIHR